MRHNAMQPCRHRKGGVGKKKEKRKHHLACAQALDWRCGNGSDFFHPLGSRIVLLSIYETVTSLSGKLDVFQWQAYAIRQYLKSGGCLFTNTCVRKTAQCKRWQEAFQPFGRRSRLRLGISRLPYNSRLTLSSPLLFIVGLLWQGLVTLDKLHTYRAKTRIMYTFATAIMLANEQRLSLAHNPYSGRL